MASARTWKPLAQLDGPHRARVEDITELNGVFSDAFTERYRRDGMVGVRVPNLNPQVWRYAIEDAAEGAMIWRDGRGDIAGFNMVHRSGVEGWMGPWRCAPSIRAAVRGRRSSSVESLGCALRVVVRA